MSLWAFFLLHIPGVTKNRTRVDTHQQDFFSSPLTSHTESITTHWDNPYQGDPLTLMSGVRPKKKPNI